MNNLRILSVLPLALFLAGCPEIQPTMPLHGAAEGIGDTERPLSIRENDRFHVERIGIFADDLAYNHKRGVYLIKDKQTGEEFVGVSGVGIAETAMHRSGKTSISDER